MIDHNFYFKILKEEIEVNYGDGSTGDVSWDQPKITALYDKIQTVLKRRFKTENKRKTTVSISTLKKIFRYKTWILDNPPKEKQLKILDKLSNFLGYEEWQHFLYEKTNTRGRKHIANPEAILNVVRKACQAEFNAYKALPNIRRSELNKYLIKGQSAYNIINEILVKHRKRGWVISNENNPSLFEIYDLSIEKIKGREAVVKSNQHWWLRWFDIHMLKYVWFYNHKGEQEFKLVFNSGKWKVKSNFYSASRDGGSFGKESV